MKTIKCDSLNEGYQWCIKAFQESASTSNGRQQGEIHELLDVEIELSDPRKSVLSLPMRNMSRKYAAGEFLLYMRGTNNAEAFKFYSKTWERLQKPDGTINSSYGYRWFKDVNPVKVDVGENAPAPITRFGFALQQLLENPDTKNAIIMLRDDDDIMPNLKDRCCTLALCFNIRNGKLNMRTIMRSQDLWTGLPYDVFCFTRLQQIMLYQYNSHSENKIELGTYTHQVLNLHVYAKHWDRVKGYTPIMLNTKEAYAFPEFTAKSDECLFPLMTWEENYRTNDIQTIEEKAYNLRELKLDPFCETLGSYLVNNIKNEVPTQFEKEMFALAEKESKNSKCIDRQVGCVITDRDGNVLGKGCNTVINCNQNCHDKLRRICNVRHGEVSAIESVPENLKALMYCAYVTLFPCFPCMQALEKTSVQWIKVKGFSHKGATGNVILYDPEFFA